MGNQISAVLGYNDFWPDLRKPIPLKASPDPRGAPTFDPMLGFPNGRKERELPVNKEDIDNARVPAIHRDYCVHKYLEARKCYRDNGLLKRIGGACDHAKHEWHSCLYDDVVLRHKEYEREKRLLARQKRRIAMGLEEDPNQQTDSM